MDDDELDDLLDDRDPADDENDGPGGGDDDSLFEEYQARAVPELTLQFGDDPNGPAWTVQAVDSDGLVDLHELTHPHDVLDALLGEDVGDEVCEALEDLPWTVTVDTVRTLRRHFAVADLPDGVWLDVVESIDLYGRKIQADLAQWGWDLLDWFRGRHPWEQLLDLIGELPEGSRYAAAVLDDEDLARERVEAGLERKRSSRPPLVGETQLVALTRATVSALNRVEHAVYAVNAKKGKAGNPPSPLKGPQTAEDRVREENALDDVAEIFDQVTPDWREQAPAGFKEGRSGLIVPSSIDD